MAATLVVRTHSAGNHTTLRSGASGPPEMMLQWRSLSRCVRSRSVATRAAPRRAWGSGDRPPSRHRRLPRDQHGANHFLHGSPPAMALFWSFRQYESQLVSLCPMEGKPFAQATGGVLNFGRRFDAELLIFDCCVPAATLRRGNCCPNK